MLVADTVLQLLTLLECRVPPSPALLVANLVRQWNMRSCAVLSIPPLEACAWGPKRERTWFQPALWDQRRQKQHKSSWMCLVTRFAHVAHKQHSLECYLGPTSYSWMHPRVSFPLPAPWLTNQSPHTLNSIFAIMCTLPASLHLLSWSSHAFLSPLHHVIIHIFLFQACRSLQVKPVKSSGS